MHETISDPTNSEEAAQVHELRFAGKRISLRWKGEGRPNDGLAILEEVQARLELLEEAAARSNRRAGSDELLLLGWLEAQREFEEYRMAVETRRAALEKRVSELEALLQPV